MYADPKHKGLQKYREVRARDKEIAILCNQIRENNPKLSDNQVQEIAKAAYTARNLPTRDIQVKRRRHNKKRRKGNFKVQVQTVEK